MNLLQEKRSVTYAIVFGIWAQVFLYCVLHDQYLIRISPEHFTVHHPPLWGITDLTLLAAAWAFRASIGPGLGLGLAALFLARAGRGPKVPPGRLLKIVPWLLVATEVAGLAAGAWAWKTKQPLFPEDIYPDLREPMLISQSIQLACYGMALLVSLGFLGWIVRQRRRQGGTDAA
jgi:hypothetical protein